MITDLETFVSQYKNGELDIFDYIDKMHQYNKFLLNLPKRLSAIGIQEICINQHSVIFTLKDTGIKLISDGARRSAPLEIMNFGEYEKEDAEILFNLVNKGDVVFDIGAHIGYFTISLTKKIKNLTIYAFEPVQKTFKYFTTNLILNGLESVFAYNCALLDEINPRKPFYYFAGGSVLASLENIIGYSEAKTIECQASTLDHMVNELKLKTLDFVKCDIEGSELLMFQGAQETLATLKPIIYSEIYEGWCKKFGHHANDILEFLKKYGYECFSAYDGFLRKETDINEKSNSMEKINFFFLHSQKHELLISKFCR